MSDCIIRFSGNNCLIPQSIEKFTDYLKNKNTRVFVVLSSIPEITEIISNQIDNIFNKEEDFESFKEKLSDTFFQVTQKEATPEYKELAENIFKLLQGISMIGDYSPALKDQLLSYSEKLSALIFEFQLLKHGAKTKIILPENYDLKISNDYGSATYLSFDKQKLNELDPQNINIIPGSYGITPEGKIARAGKSASDYTAATLAKELGAKELIIWGLKNDFFSADPQIVKSPGKIKRLTYSEASELAYFDHYSLHPRTVEPLEGKHIPIKIINTDSFQPETIINTETFISDEIIKGVAYSDDISFLKLNGPGVGLKPGILAKVTTSLNDAGINVKSVITSQISINILLARNDGEKAFELIKALGFTSVNEIELIKNVSLIGIVGHGMQQNYGVSAKIFSAVANNKINVVLSGSGASDLVSYLVVNQKDKNISIKKIYEAFFNPSNHNQ